MFCNQSIPFSETGCLFCPRSAPHDEWLIDWSQRRVRVESCQRQKYLINIWFLLFGWGDPAAGPDWPRIPADCFLMSVLIPLAGDPENHPKQNNQELGRSPVKQRGCAVKFIFREEQNNTHSFDYVTDIADPLRGPHAVLTINKKRSHCGSALIGDKANMVTPEVGTKSSLCSPTGCLILLPDSCSAFRPNLKFSDELCKITQRGAAVKPKDNETLTRKRGTPVI